MENYNNDGEERKQAELIAVRSLSVSPKSRNELARKLKEKGFKGVIIKDTLDRLEKNGFLNDKDFAKHLLSKYTHAKPSGLRKIRFDMKMKGLTPEDIAQVTEGVTLEDEVEKAMQLAETRWQRIKDLPSEKSKKRLYDLLARKGFEYNVITQVVETVMKDHEAEDWRD